MSPFCLIDVAGIRDHSTVPHDTRESTWHERLSGWMGRLLHVLHGKDRVVNLHGAAHCW